MRLLVADDDPVSCPASSRRRSRGAGTRSSWRATARFAIRPDLILLTSRDRTEDVVAGLEAAADDDIAKPFEADELSARLHVGARMVELQEALADRVQALEAALAKVRQLQGLLPICGWCKRIRSDQNYWQQIEQYVTEHSEAQFSHGICPDCRARAQKELDGLGPRRPRTPSRRPAVT